MSKLIEDLILTLTKETEIYQTLLELAEEKKQIIIDNKVKELEKTTAKEQGFMQSLMKLERLRERLVEDLIKEAGIAPVDTVTELIGRLQLEPAIKDKLMLEKNQLMDVIQELKDKNDLNGQLIAQSLRFIEFNMSIAGGLEEESTYDRDSADHKVIQKKNLFDVKV